MDLIKIKKLGIAISTFTEESTHPHRYKIIEDSLNSLIQSIKHKPKNIEIFTYIIIDGKVPQKHLTLLEKFSSQIKIVQRKDNGGISKAKNTSIRTLLQKGIDVGILVDDDVFFHKHWLETYINYIEDFQLHHHAWNDKRIFENLKVERPDSGALKSFSYIEKKGYKLFKHPASCGIFLTFTPKLIETIGYVNADISEQEIIHSVSEHVREKENKNSGLNNKDLNGYFQCIE